MCNTWQQIGHPTLVTSAYLKHTGDLSNRLHHKAVEPLDVYTLILPLLQVQLVFGILAQQVPHFFIVDLQEAGSHQKLLLLRHLSYSKQQPSNLLSLLTVFSGPVWCILAVFEVVVGLNLHRMSHL